MMCSLWVHLQPLATCGRAVFVLVLPYVPVWIHMLNNSVPSGVTTGSPGGEGCRSGLSILLSAHSSSSMPFGFYSGGFFLGGSKQGNRAHGLTMALILRFSDSTFPLTLSGWPTPSVLPSSLPESHANKPLHGRCHLDRAAPESQNAEREVLRMTGHGGVTQCCLP